MGKKRNKERNTANNGGIIIGGNVSGGVSSQGRSSGNSKGAKDDSETPKKSFWVIIALIGAIATVAAAIIQVFWG